jgi:hypothetical protein
MRRIALIGAALIASLAMTVSASARLGMAPITAQDGSAIQVKHMRGHCHGHMHRGRGHHRGWYRGRGHHKHLVGRHQPLRFARQQSLAQDADDGGR